MDKVPFKESERLAATNPELLRCPLEPLYLDWASNNYFQINALLCEGTSCAPQSVLDRVSSQVLQFYWYVPEKIYEPTAYGDSTI